MPVILTTVPRRLLALFGVVVAALGVLTVVPAAGALGIGSGVNAAVSNPCPDGFKSVVAKKNTGFVSVDDGIARGCARWDTPAGWEASSPYADGSDAVFVANQSFRSHRPHDDRRDGDHEDGCHRHHGSKPKPKKYEDDGRGEDREAVVGDKSIKPATKSNTPTPVKYGKDK